MPVAEPYQLTPGSADYYVARCTPVHQRAAVTAWLLWFAQMDRLADHVKDPGVVRLKLDWWRTEIERLPDARHPLTTNLAPYVQADWQRDQMQRVIAATEHRILKRTPADPDDLLAQCEQQGGSRAILLADNAEPALQQRAAELGRYHALVKRLGHFQRDWQQHYLNLPADFLRQQGINPADPIANKTALATALNALLAPCEQPIVRALPELRRERRLHQPLRQAVQAMYLARQMRRQDYLSTTLTWQLTPWRNLWCAWRMR
ncbi:MAG: squalene/phytoene synthase family protein [Pseudomonadota bacterium]